MNGTWDAAMPSRTAEASRERYAASGTNRILAKLSVTAGFLAWALGIFVGPGRLAFALIWSALLLIGCPLVTSRLSASRSGNTASRQGVASPLPRTSRLALGLGYAGLPLLLFGAAVAITDLVARLQSGPAGSVTPLDWLPVCFLLLAVVAAVAGVRADARGCPRLACCMTVLLFLGVFLILFLPDAYLATASARPSLIGSSSDIVYLLALLVYLAIAFIRGYELAS